MGVFQIKSIKRLTKQAIKTIFWFVIGAGIGLFLFLSFAFIIFEKLNASAVYPGISVNGIDLSGKKEKEIEDIFAQKNRKIADTKFVFESSEETATISASQVNFGYDETLIARQVMDLGRSKSVLSNISIVLMAYVAGLRLEPAYHYSEEKLLKIISPITKKNYIPASDAVFVFKNGKVTTFKPSNEGQEVDLETLKDNIASNYIKVLSLEKPQTIIISVPIKILKPNITTEKINNLGIKELIGEGTSLFQHSIPNRIYNITLASTRLNGILVAPNEEFSFVKALGDVSSFTGYKEAYIIQNGRTILGDGGGVCQVSTTLFRAILNAGLPVLERHAHAYRVGYYEQDSPPGFDATIYSPSVDLKFKNDTENYILIQTSLNPDIEQLTFSLYGTKDGRIVTISKPVITNQTPPPKDIYQDDQTLPKGFIKQVDFSAWGANVYFTREVKKNEKIIIADKFISIFQPWAAVFLRGTKE